MSETKASRLQALSHVVTVPEFIILKRQDTIPSDLDSSSQYLIRSSSKLEDQDDFSKAGQFTTLGPVAKTKIPESVEQLFKNNEVDEVIVQKYVAAREWGVAFCFSENNILIEYSGVFEGVTSGLVNPFTALLPTSLVKYKKLQQQLLAIYEQFGASDVEFVNIDDPQFVQVRPVTRSIQFDTGFVTLKMQLQEQENGSWKENDVCRVLAERDNKSQTMSELYLQALQDVYSTYLKRDINIPEKPFIKISEQYFMNQALEKQIKPGFFELIRLGFKISGIMHGINSESINDLTTIKLMQNSILLSFAYELFNKQEAMALREITRVKLDERIAQGSLPVDFNYDKILADTIECDQKNCLWKTLSNRDEQGIVVFPGDFETGPYFRLKNQNQKIPEGVIVVTEQLYPEIGQSINSIKGIICRYGSLSAHVAILAREYQVPLWIQTSIKKYE